MSNRRLDISSRSLIERQPIIMVALIYGIVLALEALLELQTGLSAGLGGLRMIRELTRQCGHEPRLNKEL